jgi:hypothetical protein
VKATRHAAYATACALVLTACVTPATGTDSYRGKASASIEAAISEVETTRIAVDALLDDRIMVPYADVTITAAESALGTISAAFGSVQPPDDPQADELRETVTALVDAAEEAVTDARIASRRPQQAGLQDALTTLDDVARELDAAEVELR